MNAMRWFRKNNKKLLAVFGVLLMVGFLLPTFAGRGCDQGRPDQTIGHLVDAGGRSQEITSSMLQRAEGDLRVLRELEIDRMAVMDVLSRLPQLSGISRSAVYAVQPLLFSQYAQPVRNFFYQQAQQSGWARDSEGFKSLVEEIDMLTGTDPARSSRYYLLLSEEARRAGIEATEQQVDAIVDVRRAIMGQGYLTNPVQLEAILDRYGISQKELKSIIGNYVGIITYGNMVTRSLALSEPELKKFIRDRVEVENVAGRFVRFDLGLYRDQISEPTAEELQEQFEVYRKYEAGKYSEENPYVFGYRLADRVELEYLRIDLEQAERVVTEGFNELAIDEQERQVQNYWVSNKEQFSMVLPSQGDSEDAEPEYYHPEFDEIAEQAQSRYLQQQAREKAEQLLADAKRVAMKIARSGKNGQNEPADYAELVRQIGTDSLDVQYSKTNYLSRLGAGLHRELGSTYKMRKDTPQEALVDSVFDCEPLHKGPVDRLEMPPVKLYEDLGPLIGFDLTGQAVAAYLVRVTGADKGREPVSLADDGKQGPAEQIAPAADSNELVERVKEDWKSLRAYELAQKHAEQFAREAQADWEGQLERANASLKTDPNAADPLREDRLQSVRYRLEQFQQIMGGQQGDSYLMAEITRQAVLLKKAMELAQEEQGDDAESLAVLSLPQELASLVFAELKVTPPDHDEYLRRKPAAAQEMLMLNQGLMAIVHFNPVNIEKRCGFVERKN